LNKKNKILLASSNKGKLAEFATIFADYEMLSQDNFDIDDAIEDGKTFFENALIKARNAVSKSNIFSIADDSGLVIPLFNSEPGIYSARYSGENASDLDNRNKVINNLKEMNLKEAPAFFVCVLVGVNSEDDPMPMMSSGVIHGTVSVKSSGDGGFGYDKIFYPSGYDVSMASLDQDSKNKISHRGIAAKSLLNILKQY